MNAQKNTMAIEDAPFAPCFNKTPISLVAEGRSPDSV